MLKDRLNLVRAHAPPLLLLLVLGLGLLGGGLYGWKLRHEAAIDKASPAAPLPPAAAEPAAEGTASELVAEEGPAPATDAQPVPPGEQTQKQNQAPPAQSEPKPATAPQTDPSAQRGATAGRGESENTAAQASARQQDLNTYVLDVIKTYGGGHYPYLLDTNYASYNGVTTNLYYQGQLLAKAHPSGNRASHCVGITFEVFLRAIQARNRAAGLADSSFNGMSYDDMYDFLLTWYVAKGPKQQCNLAVAIEKYGLGHRLHDWKAAKAGDFIDFSRTNGTGHAAIFINWIRRDGEIIGLRYWSSQESTGGIAYQEEYFNLPSPSGRPYGSIRQDKVYLARVGPIDKYR